jgi:predicted nuclease of predicted toxin-antitoxin system
MEKPICKQELAGQTDPQILRYAQAVGRVVLTHDSDFGWVVIAQDQTIFGIIYLRPGHIKPDFTIETIRAIDNHLLMLSPHLF